MKERFIEIVCNDCNKGFKMLIEKWYYLASSLYYCDKCQDLQMIRRKEHQREEASEPEVPNNGPIFLF